MTRDYGEFFVHCMGNPQSWPRKDDPWKPIGECHYVILGDFIPKVRESYRVDGMTYIKTPCRSSVPVYPAIDRRGAVWSIPVIINNHDGVNLALEWGLDGDSVVRKPTDQQRAIIETCETMRDLLDASDETLPLDAAAKGAGLIMSFSYHAHPDEFIEHGILDCHLVPRVLMAACGRGTPEHGAI